MNLEIGLATDQTIERQPARTTPSWTHCDHADTRRLLMQPGNVAPFVSVILPVRNEADFVAESLSAVLAQDYPHHCMEILVADGMSTDETRQVIARLVAGNPDISIAVLDNPGRIVPTGLNIALARAKGDIIVRVDGHCRIAPDYVSRCVAHLMDDGVDGVGGPIETIAGTPMGDAIAAAMSSSFGVGGSAFRTVKDRTMLADTVPFPAYTRRAIERAGAFDEELIRNQDDEYNYRLRKLGGKILLAADVKSLYYSRGSLRSLWKQYFQYGYYKARVLQKHPRQMCLRQFVPPVFVLTMIASAMLSPFSIVAGAMSVAAIGSYCLVNGAASLGVAASSAGWHQLGRLPAVFAALHLSYGIGFWVGAVNLLRRESTFMHGQRRSQP